MLKNVRTPSVKNKKPKCIVSCSNNSLHYLISFLRDYVQLRTILYVLIRSGKNPIRVLYSADKNMQQ